MKDETQAPETGIVMEGREILQMRLKELRRRHRELDDEISAIGRAQAAGDPLRLHRLKREKLGLRDQITALEDRLTPDIIA